MSFFENSIQQINQTGLDVLISRPGSYRRIMPGQLVLSSQCFLSFKINEKEEYIAEFDQFTKTKIITEKKNFKPYGHMHNMSLINDQGWELSLTGKKTDPKLGSIIALQEYLTSGDNNSGSGDKYKASSVKLTFDIVERVTYKPDPTGRPTIEEIYKYKDCSLASYSEDTPSDNQPVTFNMKLFCPKRFFTRSDLNYGDNIYTSAAFNAEVYNMIDRALSNNSQ